MPVNAVLQKIGNQSGIRFSYDPDLISSKRKVTLKAVNRPLGEVLETILGNSGYAFREIGNQLVIYHKNSEPEMNRQEPTRQDQKIVLPVEKRAALPDTVIITRTDTIRLLRTDTLVKTETVIQHDTVRRTDTIYIERYKTQKSGRSNMPTFEKNSMRNQKFRENNGFYACLTYQQLIGKASFAASSSTFNELAQDMKDASSGASNYSVGALLGYDYLRFGIQSGISFTRLGETFDHSYTKQVGGYYKTDTVDQYYTVSGPDTSYYYVTDSSWVNIDYKKFAYKNPNTYRYLEIPVMAKFRIFQGKALELYGTGGIITSFLIGNKALYIKPDEEKSVEWIRSSQLKPLIFSFQAGAGAVYNFGGGLGFLIEATYRNQLSSQYKDYPLRKKFELLNIKTGIFVRL